MDEKDRRKNNRKNEETEKVCHQRPYKLGLQQVDLKKKLKHKHRPDYNLISYCP